MSNDQQGGEGARDPAETLAAPPADGTSPLRLVVLLLVFGVALAGLLYDYTVARPAIRKADQLVQGCFTGTTADPDGDGTYTDDEVQLILQSKPATIENLENGKIEIYTWRSGLPFRPYRLYVVYTGKKVALLHFASTSRPNEAELPKVTRSIEPTQEELDNFVPVNPGAGEDEGQRDTKVGKKGKKAQPDEPS